MINKISGAELKIDLLIRKSLKMIGNNLVY